VVLLIDDPPKPSGPAAAAALRRTRSLVAELADLLAAPRRRCEASLADFEARRQAVGSGAASERDRQRQSECARLVSLYREVASWFDRQAELDPAADHTAALFVEITFRRRALQYQQTAQRLAARAALATWDELATLHRQLAEIFRVEFASFERKRYANLSDAQNKAMNLNSYIGLLGKNVTEIEDEQGCRIEIVPPGASGQLIPGAEYVLTLDADSILCPDYSARLVLEMEATGNERVAVAQTPYSAVRGAPGTLERIAGATTDMQYIVHQGFTRHGATFWVGANALLRKAALDDIAVTTTERGREVTRFIQDRTVIEDTESSVDLIARGWRLVNYPERLSYSATPPDFGALVIQRRRWANGGLIILPKLLRYLAGRPRAGRLGEGFMRFHYLTSIAGANLAFLALVLFPFSGWLSTVWLPLTALPYFLLYGRDLRSRGYRHADVVRVYALNVLLVGANLAGVVKSLHQAVSGRPTPFKRTPKVHDRTPAPALYVFIPYAMGLYLCVAVGWDLTAERWAHATVGALNAVLIFYAIHFFIGARTSCRDLIAPFRSDTSHERVAGRLRAWKKARRAARVGGVLAPLPSLAPDTAGAGAIAADIQGSRGHGGTYGRDGPSPAR
jgi:hypothetical protein